MSAPRFTAPPTLWYENEQGEKWIPESFGSSPPEGFKYQNTQFPLRLHHSICTSDGQLLANSSCGYPEDLAVALLHDGYTLGEAILIAANMCEACLNATANDYGLTWGYPRGSEAHLATGTSCEFCRKAMEVAQ